MIYLFQVVSSDYHLVLRTECDAQSLSELKLKAKNMIKYNPELVGMKYIIASIEKDVASASFKTVTLKKDVIAG